MSLVAVTDAISNRPEHIVDGANAIGRSEIRRKVFEGVYRGKKTQKSVVEIASLLGYSQKQVLEAGKVLARAGLLTERPKGGMKYEKISSVAHNRDKILRLVSNPALIKSIATKRNPVSSSPSLFKAVSANRHTSAQRSFRQVGGKPPRWRIAMLLASPIGQTPIDTPLEAREVEVEIRKSSNRDKFDLRFYLAATEESLANALNEYEPAIVHFSGHGGDRTIVFDNKNIEHFGGRSVDISKVARILKTANTRPRLVVLNACDTLNGANVLLEGTDAVIAMSKPIPDSAAAAFSRRLYAALTAGVPLDSANEQACALLAIDDPDSAEFPQVLVASGKDASMIVFN